MSNNFYTKLSDLSNIKNIPESEIQEMVKDCITKIFEKNFDADAELEFIFDQKNKEFKLINHTKYVVPNVDKSHLSEDEEGYEPSCEIPLSEARLINPNAQVDDIMSQEVDFDRFSGKTYTQIRSLFLQSIREWEKQAVYRKYFPKIGEIIKARLETKTSKSYLFVLEDGTEAFMPKSGNYIHNVPVGTIMDVVIIDVLEESKNAQVIISGSERAILEKILREEIPELSQGIVEIVDIARTYGIRSKISVRVAVGQDASIDPVGTMIGPDGNRVQSIESKLNGEKVEIVAWSSDIKKYIINSLTPARVIDVVRNESLDTETMQAFDVIVPDRQHTLAIGRKGNNVILAVELTKSKINVISQSIAIENGIHFEWNGNITQEEVEQLERGHRLKVSVPTKASVQKKSQRKFENFNIDKMWESEIAQFHSEMDSYQNDDFEKALMEMNANTDFISDDMIKNYLDEMQNEEESMVLDEKEDSDVYSKQKQQPSEDYEKITKTKMKDFKVDKDLASGLENINWDDEDWD
ncbi:transcription termination factor NusA [Mycoplasma sp. 392]